MNMIEKKWLIVFLYFFSIQSIFSRVQKAHLSSSWYPSDKNTLHAALKKNEAIAREKYDMRLDSNKIRAIIVPHAGWEYSGAIASSAFRLIQPGSFDRVVLLSPSHNVSFQGLGLPYSEQTGIRTAIGDIAFDMKMLKSLRNVSSWASEQKSAHELEHAIEVQVPMIQKYCGEKCKLVPLLVGQITESDALLLSKELAQFLNDRTLLVISSDFTHYGSRFNYTPFKSNITQQIYKLDSSVVQEIVKGDLQGFSKILSDTGATVCGRSALKLLVALLQQNLLGYVEPYLVGYDTSASDENNPEHSVSYVGMIFSEEHRPELPLNSQLTDYEKKYLLKLAREKLNRVTSKKHHHGHGHKHQEKKDSVGDDYMPGMISHSMKKTQGAFVTLHEVSKDNVKKLRGCIGNIIGQRPLGETVSSMTESAALHDSRFTPVKKEEVPHIQISVSALTTPKVVKSHEEIQLGRDGIILEHSGRSAVYLPKVAAEQGWTLPQTLSSLSQKAGLHKNAWREKQARFKTFQSIDFAEKRTPSGRSYISEER